MLEPLVVKATRAVPRREGRSNPSDLSDVIFAKSKEEIVKVYYIINLYLEEMGLILAEDKTRITHISEGFDFLSFEIRQRRTKDGDKCFIKPSKDSVKNARIKIAERFELMKGHNVGDLINTLNPLLLDL